MKKIYALMATAMLSFGASAQVNLDFEAPITPLVAGYASSTEGWGQALYVATAGFNSAQGVLMETKDLTGVGVPGVTGVRDGFIQQRFAVTGFEAYASNVTLDFDFKYEPVSGDTMFVGWRAINVTGSTVSEIYSGSFIFDESTEDEWSYFPPAGLDRDPDATLPVTHLEISFFSGYLRPTVGSKLYVDNVIINGLPSVSIADLGSVNGVKLFPNPATDVVNVSIESGDVASIDVMTLDGKVVISTQDTKVDVSELTSGMYIFNVRATNGATSTQKVTVK